MTERLCLAAALALVLALPLRPDVSSAGEPATQPNAAALIDRVLGGKLDAHLPGFVELNALLQVLEKAPALAAPPDEAATARQLADRVRGGAELVHRGAGRPARAGLRGGGSVGDGRLVHLDLAEDRVRAPRRLVAPTPAQRGHSEGEAEGDAEERGARRAAGRGSTIHLGSVTMRAVHERRVEAR